MVDSSFGEVLRRAPQVGIFRPNARPHPFAYELHALVQRRGGAAYVIEMGAHRRDVVRAARATQPDTGLVFVEYAPGDYQLLGLALAVLRWKRRGAFVVLCRSGGALGSARQRAAYRVVRGLVDLEVPLGATAEEALAAWPAKALPRESYLAGVWVTRTEPPRLEQLVPLLECPRCRGALRMSGEGLACEGCEAVHPIVDGIPVLLPEGAHAQVEEDEHAYPAGDAYTLGGEPQRPWLEIGLYKRDLVARMVRRPAPTASIDVGCGDWGLHHDVIAAIGSELAVSGDVSLKLVDFARSHATAPNRVHHMVFSAEALPFRAATFDLVYCSEVLEHLDHPERALAEMARAGLGGRCILTVPNEVVTGKLEKGHVQTFGYDSFLELVHPYVDVRHVRGLFLFGKGVTPSLTQTPRGRVRFAASLWLGQRMPRRSLSILTDGILRPA